jgi:hypothetical protein
MYQAELLWLLDQPLLLPKDQPYMLHVAPRTPFRDRDVELHGVARGWSDRVAVVLFTR